MIRRERETYQDRGRKLLACGMTLSLIFLVLFAQAFEKMKILIPYDGSRNAELALRELQIAGIDKDDEMLVLVSDVWLPETPEEVFAARAARRRKLGASGNCSYSPALRNREEEQMLCREVESAPSSIPHLRSAHVAALPGYGLIPNQIIERSKKWGAELIILGAGKGITSETSRVGWAGWRIAKSSDCSIRIARETGAAGKRSLNAGAPTRVAVFAENSLAGIETVQAVARRTWHSGSKALLVAAGDQISRAGECPSPRDQTTIELCDKEMLLPGSKSFMSFAANLLEEAGLVVSTMIPDGVGTALPLEEIGVWKPDSVFFAGNRGANESGGFRQPVGIENLMVNLLREADCSVEMIRSGERDEVGRASLRPSESGINSISQGGFPLPAPVTRTNFTVV